jgi:hypothetical protein
MFLNWKPEFEVVHSGRGGTINFKLKGNKDSFNIEMGPGGNFLVFTGRSSKYAEIRMALREFLGATNREGWIIDE